LGSTARWIAPEEIIMNDSYQVQLDVFEGPLDLLLHLVKKHELDILDIPIAFVTEKYLAYLDAADLGDIDIDLAGEYLVMAATLCHIKSRELLPSSDGTSDDDEVEAGDADDDELDPRGDLIRRLLEYQKYKEAAQQLGERPVVGRNVWGRGTALEDAIADNVDPDAVAPLASFPVHKLIEALDRLMRQAKVRITHDVLIERLSLSQRIAELTDRLEREGRFTFTSMFRFARGDVAMSVDEIRNEAVVTFLAILEMAKLRLIVIDQVPGPHEGDDEIWIARAAEDLRDQVEQKIAVGDDYRG
jgi:segregation and condensation protein A